MTGWLIGLEDKVVGEGGDKSYTWKDKQEPCVNQLSPVFKNMGSRY